MTNDEIRDYYANLLSLQYVGKSKAYATIQATAQPLVMDQLPVTVQNGFCLGDTTINGVTYPGATGVQLDVLGKYLGVTRTGNDLNGNPVTLNDVEFTSLIKIAVIQNLSGSSLAAIQKLLHLYFANEIFVFDGADMQMSYIVSSSVGSQSLVELFLTEGLFPKPMGVQLSSIVYISSISLFGFLNYDDVPDAWSSSTNYVLGDRVFVNGIVYQSLSSDNLNHAVTNATYWVAIIYPFNTYATYPTANAYKFLSYSDTISL